MGMASLNQSKVAKNIDKNGQKFKLTRQSINTTKQQNTRNILESWGQYVKQGNPLPSKVDGYEREMISTLHKSAFLDPDILDWITDIGTAIPLYFLTQSRLEFAIIGGVVDTGMLIFSRLEKRNGVTEIPLKAGRRQPWFNEYQLFQLGKIKGLYKDVSFKVFSFDYARKYNGIDVPISVIQSRISGSRKADL